MFKNKKIIILGILFVILLIVNIVLVVSNIYDYLIVLTPLAVILLIWLIYEIKCHNSSDEDAYNRALKKIIKVYNSIIVNIDTFPKLNNKSVLNVKDFNDLVDAQSETRKPIYYVKGNNSTAFYLINDDVFLIYFLKINKNELCDLELELKKDELQSSLNLDAIKDFDRTVVVHSNNKSYRVSPIREKKEENEDSFIPKKKKI